MAGMGDTISVRFLITSKGYRYGDPAELPDADWVWAWLGMGLLELVDDEPYQPPVNVDPPPQVEVNAAENLSPGVAPWWQRPSS